MEEVQCLGRVLLGEQRVPEVDHDAEVVDAGVLDIDQGGSRGAPEQASPGSFSLYSMAKVVLGVVAGDIADTAEAMLAELCVVHLEGVVVAVLPGS